MSSGVGRSGAPATGSGSEGFVKTEDPRGTRKETEEQIRARTEQEKLARIDELLAPIRAAEEKWIKDEEAAFKRRVSGICTGELPSSSLIGRVSSGAPPTSLQRDPLGKFRLMTSWDIVQFWQPPADSAAAPRCLRRSDSLQARCEMHELYRVGIGKELQRRS